MMMMMMMMIMCCNNNFFVIIISVGNTGLWFGPKLSGPLGDPDYRVPDYRVTTNGTKKL